jgi:hypothetical protein
MTRKFHFVGLVAMAVFAMFAVMASAAFAESEFLLNGNVVVANDAVDASGELELSDLKVPLLGTVSVLCSGILDGHFTSATTGVVTEVLTLAEVLTGALGGVGLACTNVTGCVEPLVFADNLPWPFTLELVAGVFLLHLGEEPGLAKAAGYDVECMATGATDLCEGLTLFLVENTTTDIKLVKNLAEDEEEALAEELGTCSLGGAQAADVLTDEGAGTEETLMLDPVGTLQVS